MNILIIEDDTRIAELIITNIIFPKLDGVYPEGIMKIHTRLTLLFTLITATILLAFAFVIYHVDTVNREKEFYSLLKKEAITKANLILNARVEPEILQDIYRSNRQILNEVEVAIYDTEFNLLYHDAMDIDFVKETQEMIDEIILKQEIEFYQEDWQVVGLLYPFQGSIYIVTAAAYDQYGFNKLNSLRYTDKGIGISENDLEKLFTAFYLGENKQFADGNGNGLSLTHKIISLHHGLIKVSSEIIKETVFSIELPHLNTL